MSKHRRQDGGKADAAAQAGAKAYDKANAEILALYETLAKKLRARAQKALARSEAADGVRKRVAKRKAFEIYGDAATEVEHRVAVLRSRVEAAPTPPKSAR
jgi:hypothetical protein